MDKFDIDKLSVRVYKFLLFAGRE